MTCCRFQHFPGSNARRWSRLGRWWFIPYVPAAQRLNEESKTIFGSMVPRLIRFRYASKWQSCRGRSFGPDFLLRLAERGNPSQRAGFVDHAEGRNSSAMLNSGNLGGIAGPQTATERQTNFGRSCLLSLETTRNAEDK